MSLPSHRPRDGASPSADTDGSGRCVGSAAQASSGAIAGHTLRTHATISRIGPDTEFTSGIASGAEGDSITAGAEGDLWFTQSDGQLDQSQIGRIAPAGVVTEFPTGNDEVPEGITFGAEGNMWFAELGGEIGRITPKGAVTLFPLGRPGSEEAVGITTGREGDLWITQDSGQIGRMTKKGKVTEYPTGSAFETPDGDPDTIVTGPEGDLWFTEFATGRIGRITPKGVITQFSSGITPSSGPNGIAAGPEGDFWFTQTDEQIGRITPAGVVTEFSNGIARDSRPDGIAQGPEGDLWFTQPETGQIGRISPTTGEVTEFPARDFSGDGIALGPDGGMWFAQGEAEEIGRIGTGLEFSGPRPAVTGLTPAKGVEAGGTEVTITGANLTNVTSVEFGATPAESFEVLSSSSIIAIAPAGAKGVVDVTVTSAGGTSAITKKDRFKYVP